MQLILSHCRSFSSCALHEYFPLVTLTQKYEKIGSRLKNVDVDFAGNKTHTYTYIIIYWQNNTQTVLFACMHVCVPSILVCFVLQLVPSTEDTD